MRYTKEDVIAARKLIESPDNWCQEAYARNKDDYLSSIASPSACKFCAVGSVIRANDQRMNNIQSEDVFIKQNEVTNLFAEYAGIGNIISFNDENQHDKILLAFDKLIAAMPD